MKLFTPLLLLLSLTLNAKENYTAYYNLINKAEEQFVGAKDRSCFSAYDKAFKLNKPFLKDPFIASQIAYFLKDTVKCLSYLRVCFENGMPMTAMYASKLFRAPGTAFEQQVRQLFSRSYKAPRVDTSLNDLFCLLCYQSDSFKVKVGGRSEAFYANENASRQIILDSFLKRGMFPNEKLLGITTDQSYEAFYAKFNRKSVYGDSPFPKTAEDAEELELRRKCPYNIVLHSKCFFREHKRLFFEAMLAGYLHPKEFGILEETSIVWGESNRNPAETCEPAQPRICYNIFRKNPMSAVSITGETEAELAVVEKNRASIHLQKYVVDLAKKGLEKETGIKFFFDFVDR